MPAPGIVDVVVDWQLEPTALVVVIALGCWYAAGVRRLAARQHRWATSRTVAAVVAGVAAVIATQSGIGRYDTSRFSVHMVQHLLLGLVVPLAIVRAAPLTLLLQSVRPPARLVASRVLRSTPMRVLTHPLAGWLLFGGGLVALYTTSLLDVAARSSVIHLAVHAHLVASGTLFLLPLVGIDALPRRLGHPVRLLAILAAVPFHAFLAVALLSARAPVAPQAYPSLADQRTAAGILWGAGELLTAVVAALALHAWLRADRREQARLDRRAATASAAAPTGYGARP